MLRRKQREVNEYYLLQCLSAYNETFERYWHSGPPPDRYSTYETDMYYDPKVDFQALAAATLRMIEPLLKFDDHDRYVVDTALAKYSTGVKAQAAFRAYKIDPEIARPGPFR